MFSEEKYFDKEHLVDEILKTEPEFVLSDNFADNLAKIIDRKIAWSHYWNEFLVYLGAIIGIVAVSAAMSILLFGANWKEWANFITVNVSLVSGISFLVVFVLFADRVLLRYYLNKSSEEIA